MEEEEEEEEKEEAEEDEDEEEEEGWKKMEEVAEFFEGLVRSRPMSWWSRCRGSVKMEVWGRKRWLLLS